MAARRVAQKCAELPPRVEGLYELAWRIHKRIEGMVDRGEASWASLPPQEQEEMEEAVAMQTKAAAAGHAGAQCNLGVVYHKGRGVARDLDRAEELYAPQAGQQGHADGYFNLGHLLKYERQEVDGAEKAYRAAIEADPGYAKAHFNLGVLLKTERKDVDGAEEAFRAATEADPGHAKAHKYLGLLLKSRAREIEKRGADPAKAASLYQEAAGYLALA